MVWPNEKWTYFAIEIGFDFSGGASTFLWWNSGKNSSEQVKFPRKIRQIIKRICFLFLIPFQILLVTVRFVLNVYVFVRNSQQIPISNRHRAMSNFTYLQMKVNWKEFPRKILKLLNNLFPYSLKVFRLWDLFQICTYLWLEK